MGAGPGGAQAGRISCAARRLRVGRLRSGPSGRAAVPRRVP
ncbi:hypothetical protein [Lysobacter gummosus]